MSVDTDDYTEGVVVTDYVEPTHDHDPIEWERGGQDREDDQRDRDVFADGFFVVSAGTPRWTVPTCRYCGTDLFGPALRWICEVAGDVTERPKFSGWVLKDGLPAQSRERTCKCNACEYNAIVYREGRPPTVCTATECVRRRRREERALERDRRNVRERGLAAQWLTEYPGLSDRDIADQAGIRPVRVKEVRRELVAAT